MKFFSSHEHAFLSRHCIVQYNQYGEEDPYHRLDRINASTHLRFDINSYKTDGHFMDSCAAAQKHMDELSEKLLDGSVVFHTGFSYPFGDPFGTETLDVHQYPDILKIVQWTQNAKPFPFDLRLLVLKRTKWSTALQSVISRYCNQLKVSLFLTSQSNMRYITSASESREADAVRDSDAVISS